MTATEIATSVLSLIAGVGIFLIACTMMSSNLEALGSRKLKSLFAKASKSKLLGVGVGAATTAVIQSSSATSVMVIGFVNAGIMTLTQAATVIFGANIGTTITGQLVALGMFGSNTISTSVIFATFTEQMAQNHIRRLESGKCTAEVEAQYISLSANAERIADHFINVAKTINSYK